MRVLIISFILISSSLNLYGQCKNDYNDFSMKISSDEAAAYSLLLYTVEGCKISMDSVTVYSVYRFADQELFPAIWKMVIPLSNLKYKSISKSGKYVFIEILSKDRALTIIRASLFDFAPNSIKLLGSFSQKHCLTSEGSELEYSTANQSTDLMIYFDF